MKERSKTILLRAILLLLILANMTVIFLFSAEDGKTSGQTSGKVTHAVAQTVVPDFKEKPAAEQTKIVKKMEFPIRKLAHMTEFASLGLLLFLFLQTWKGNLWLRYFASLGLTAIYAASDEFHQYFSDGRGAQFTDVLIDLSGALISCTLLLLLILLLRYRKKKTAARPVRVTEYAVASEKVFPSVRIAVAADLHGADGKKVVEALRRDPPDLILIPGDLMEDADLANPFSAGYSFLRACASVAPTFYSLGNHEVGCYHRGNPWRHPYPVPLTEEIRGRVRATGAVLLEDSFVHWNGFCLCGLNSGICGKENRPDEDAIRAFSGEDGIKILLCHHPEYYVPYLRDAGIDLTVCGHAHGGQWRLFGHGVYAPGQGLFPKYTSGVIDGKCVISRGLGNHTKIPRIANPTELVLIRFGGQTEPEKT